MASLRAARGDHWRDEHTLVHFVWYVYPNGAFVTTCGDKVPKKVIGAGITKGPLTCLECHDTPESLKA